MPRTWLSRLLALFRRDQLERDLDEEIRTHLELATEENIRRGMSSEEARYAARRSFGGVEQMKEERRDRRALPLLETLVQDLGYGVRVLRKSPGLVTAVVVSISLGIGPTRLLSVWSTRHFSAHFPSGNPSGS